MIVNGKEMEFIADITVAQLLDNLNIDKNKVVVEVEMKIIYQDAFANTKIGSDAKVEIIHFMGGG